MWADRTQRSTARARFKLACFATPRETASAVAFARVPRESRLRVGGHSSLVVSRSCTEGERSSAGAAPYVAYAVHHQHDTARARQLAYYTISRETATAVALVRVPRECRLSVGGHSFHVAPRSCTERKRRPAGAVPLRSCVGRSQTARHGAREAGSRVSSPPEKQPPQWRSFACHGNAGCALEVTARTSHHGLAPKERGLSSVQCPSIVRKPITTNAARRTRAAGLRVPPPPERQPAQWRLSACHENTAFTLEVTALTSHHGLAPKERGVPPVQCPCVVA